MSEIRFKTTGLYVVRPSTVLSVTSKDKKNFKKNINRIAYKVKLENKKSDTTIAYRDNLVLKDIETEEIIYNTLSLQSCCTDEKYVNVDEQDKVLLARYLWEKNIHANPYNVNIEQYIISLKPFYTLSEIKKILLSIRKEAQECEKVKRMVLKRKFKQPIMIRNIYTDPC